MRNVKSAMLPVRNRKKEKLKNSDNDIDLNKVLTEMGLKGKKKNKDKGFLL